MIKAFLYEHIAITVRHWFEINLDTAGLEHGVRVEVRLLEDQAHRGTESAAQRIVVDDTAWRVDIFEKLDSPPGSLSPRLLRRGRRRQRPPPPLRRTSRLFFPLCSWRESLRRWRCWTPRDARRRMPR